jgi:hypothetical protein
MMAQIHLPAIVFNGLQKYNMKGEIEKSSEGKFRIGSGDICG